MLEFSLCVHLNLSEFSMQNMHAASKTGGGGGGGGGGIRHRPAGPE